MASAIPSRPSAKKRSFHLYPVFALTPYSLQSARKLSVLIAFKANNAGKLTGARGGCEMAIFQS